ncbi:tRNA (adenosine(37)-N6)-threonylcarbamoyltransferase complex dimerization subunit type 1 TsaB [Lysinibacillus sp. BW-2-10]|uniref:tRNA (adenosine(37)-N6)-threonylcarbamoyltransferase complex dimerization subunit type 1 TsaB n=1 Tax=Lysinibacillus sp. BW-2-10 TaxID=2590030 RepID=UPI00117CC693|nr:tRNA (adenosine(37)-N6)-threonylcarbamoyltransferase complex dimerization subunit type 1 TsaB [Lysinibacillus sp. BW-2-10]TSI04552.1 tRNA (adenosine(37)-N6)-threonylcarbamoyltransferase complex dimerization subunit type 1 TsaB [Lysinibacillus sp. BW-2-10]
MIWLGIETSNAPLSVAIVKDGQVLAEIVQNIKQTHSVTVMPTIEELLKKANIRSEEIDAIAVAEGPGSYTGLRIGVTIAKTLAWTLKIPVVGVSSLKVLAANGELFNGIICPLFDARRQNVYAAAYKGLQLEKIIEEHHGSIDELLLRLDQTKEPILFVGLDVENFKDKIIEQLGDRAYFANSSYHLPRASKLIALAEDQPMPTIEDVHIFVPKYHRIAQAEAEWIKEQKKGKQ